MEALLAEFAKRCVLADASDAPKYRRLMNAIQDSIRSGVLAPGDRLPTEQDLAGAVPYALGTVQKALNGLVSEGLLRRSRRSGTFVSDKARPLDDTSQFDFKHADGTEIGEVLTEITEISSTRESGCWTAILGECPSGYVEIKRLDRIGSNFHCYVEVHLRADRFSGLLAEEKENLSGQNMRTVLETRHGVSVASLDIASGAVFAPAHVAWELGIRKDETVHQVDITGFDAGGGALYTQTTYAPAGNYRLTFKKEIN
jgi:GntR family transcriptional regulator